jgi:DNA-binding PadR family transcriptional regulator
LLSLASGPRHGYAIMQDVRLLSGGRVALSTGTLYGALRRLLDGGWIARLAGPDEEAQGRPHKDYVLTDLGRQIFAAEARRMDALVQAARSRAQTEGI